MDVGDPMATTKPSSEIVTPWHRVPPEIIVKIIHELLPIEIDYYPLTWWRLDVLFKVTSICRYWRYAAIDHATLWSVIPIDHRSLGELFLQRSRDAPLSITYVVETRRCCPAHQAMVSLLPHMQRVKKVQFRAPAPALNEIFSTLNSYARGAQLEEVCIQAHDFPGDEGYRATLDLLLKHASTLKVLMLNVSKCRFPAHKLRQFSHLSHLELLSTHDIRNISSLLTSLPALTSIKARVDCSGLYEDDRRIVPQSNLRHIHLQIVWFNPSHVFDTLKIPTGVHLICEFTPVRSASEASLYLPLSSEFFENTSHIEKLRISIYSCSGWGPSGSFYIDRVVMSGFRPPIEDLSHLRILTVDHVVEQQTLEDFVRSAPRLVSVGFAHCTLIGSRAFGRTLKMLPSPVDTDAFVKAISEGRHAGAGADAGDSSDIVVNGILEGERLKEFRFLIGDRN